MIPKPEDTERVREVVEDFYCFIDSFDTDYADLQTLEREVATETDPAIRDLWLQKRERYELRLIKSADHLLETVTSLRLMAERMQLKAAALDELARAISYRPHLRLPPIRPTEDLVSRASDDCERIKAIFHLPLESTRASDATRSPTVDETEVALLTENAKTILRRALALKAIDAASRQKGRTIITSGDHLDDPELYKRNFSQLVKDGFLETRKGTTGYWLTFKGQAAAQWLRDRPLA